MPHKQSIISDKTILRMKLMGRIDLTERNTIKDEVAGICRMKLLRKILIDVRELDPVTSLIDLYDFGSTLTEIELPFDVKIAGVCKPDDLESTFPVTIAKNKLINISAFPNVRKALHWLST